MLWRKPVIAIVFIGDGSCCVVLLWVIIYAVLFSMYISARFHVRLSCWYLLLTSSSPYRAIFVRITVYPVYDQIMQFESRRSCTVFTKSLRESPAASNDTCMVLITRSKQSMVSNRHERQNMQLVATHNADQVAKMRWSNCASRPTTWRSAGRLGLADLGVNTQELWSCMSFVNRLRR